MREVNDWRLTNQLNYLKGATLSRREYSRWSDSWDHDHCAFCGAKFMEKTAPDIQRSGYSTPDEYHWVCDICFEDSRICSNGLRQHRSAA